MDFRLRIGTPLKLIHYILVSEFSACVFHIFDGRHDSGLTVSGSDHQPLWHFPFRK